MKLEDLYELNNFCRKNNINFIYTLNLVLTGFLFNDFGENYSIYDCNGEKKLSFDIFFNEEKKNIYVLYKDIKNDEQFELYKRNYVIFKKVKGLEFLNVLKPGKIIKNTKSYFELEKENEFNNKYISDGIIKETIIQKRLKFKSFKYNFI